MSGPGARERAISFSMNRETRARLEYLVEVLSRRLGTTSRSRAIRAAIALLWFMAVFRPEEFERLVEEFRRSGITY